MIDTPFTLSRRSALSLLLAGTATLAAPVRALAASQEGGAAALLDKIAWDMLQHVPESATGLGVDVGEHAALRARLEDRSRSGREAYAATLRQALASVDAVDATGLDHSTRTSLAVVKSAFGTALEGFALPYGDVAVGGWRNTPYVVIQNVGAYIDTPRLLDAEHPVRNPGDADAWISRLSQFAPQLEGERTRVEEAAAKGLVPPDFLLDRAIAQMTSTIADARNEGGSLVISITGKTKEMGSRWGADAKRIVAGDVVPALERQLAELQRERSMARSDPGMRERPHGSEFYAWALRASTTTTLSADEVHQRGLQELADLHARMEPILRSLGYTQGSVGERMAALGDDKRFMFAEGDPGRAEIFAFIQKRVDWIRQQMPRAFRQVVPGNLEVRRLPLSEEPGAPTAYGGAGSKDGSIPGKMWINLRSTSLHRTYDLPTLVHHEAIPGHVWQGEYANRLPLIRSLLAFNAYSEGWALYGEQLADELGAYDDDPVGRLGYLQSLAFRACRMVVDTGLHAKGWTREQAVRFFMEKNGNKQEEVVNEVDRYCSWPGQACGYKMGHSQIVAQRTRAMQALGKSYDLRDYNQAVVDGGNVPLDVLARNVSEYIAARKV
ncbi:DUF885 family protein [Novosphingobium panipatense]|jgi:uncharacterized protein (DUF885 family)|uniref:DUF885 domain-containing protein n=1 Tax=Novosphingobium TaxID=165696 RepID=UPI000CDA0FAF|nr:DUF885 domain-containing protein [Novosphingobium sp. HII-3]